MNSLIKRIEILANLQAEYFNPGRQDLLDRLTGEYMNKAQQRSLEDWQEKIKQGYHSFYCLTCQVWYHLSDDELKDAEFACECEFCGTMIIHEVVTYWQATEVLGIRGYS